MPIDNKITLVPYTEADSDIWDEYIATAPMVTLLHTRRYLAYHADRFQDVSLLIKDEKDNIVGLFLAALDPNDSSRVVSHPGITYGGLLHQGSLRGEKMIDSWKLIKQYYASQGLKQLVYKAIPSIYFQTPAFDDLYALFRLGALRYRCDLSCSIDLEHRLQPSKRRQRALKKAHQKNVTIKEGFEFISSFWEVLIANLAEKHNLTPVHTIEEILHLKSLFPENIQLIVAFVQDKVEAGVILFDTPNVSHAQYIGSSIIGYEVSALESVFEFCINISSEQKKRYFNFGISTEQEGQHLNHGLYQFKSEFGGGGIIQEFYQLQLN
jgi:Acetyltransferase (GNAT) domain